MTGSTHHHICNLYFGLCTLIRLFLVKLSREGNTTGLKETSTRTGFSIFPNPGPESYRGKFTITCESNTSSAVNVTVRNISGQVIYQKRINCNADKNFTLDLGKQLAGNCTVEIGSGLDRIIKKVIVE